MERLQVESLEVFLKWLKRKQGIELRKEIHSSLGILWVPPFKGVDELINEFYRTAHIPKKQATTGKTQHIYKDVHSVVKT